MRAVPAWRQSAGSRQRTPRARCRSRRSPGVPLWRKGRLPGGHVVGHLHGAGQGRAAGQAWARRGRGGMGHGQHSTAQHSTAPHSRPQCPPRPQPGPPIFNLLSHRRLPVATSPAIRCPNPTFTHRSPSQTTLPTASPAYVSLLGWAKAHSDRLDAPAGHVICFATGCTGAVPSAAAIPRALTSSALGLLAVTTLPPLAPSWRQAAAAMREVLSTSAPAGTRVPQRPPTRAWSWPSRGVSPPTSRTASTFRPAGQGAGQAAGRCGVSRWGDQAGGDVWDGS